MDSCGGCGSGGEGDQLPPTAPTLPHTSRDKDRTKKSTEKLLTAAGDQWSQEENSEEASGRVGLPPITNGVGGSGVNGLHLEHGGTAGQSLLNNNLVEEKCNLRRADDKTLCLYHKFPAKVNNNVYSEGGAPARDGMDEYFQSHHSSPSRPSAPTPARRNGLSPGREQLNLLNGEEEDEDDGCIYSYKGESLEANLSHLIDMCLSCGLPNPERAAARSGAPRGPEGPAHSNLFSPEMDFLEMDFDPGPGGDGEADSDCEDNCLHECDSRLGRGGVAGPPSPGVAHKANNYCPEMLSLMCRRCESSLCDGKIDNVAPNLSVAPAPAAPPLNIGRGPSAGLDHRPEGSGGGLNLPRSGLNLPQDLNVGLNQLCGRQGPGRIGSGEEEEEDAPDNDSVENNMLDTMDHLSDDADDEDDSNSEKYEPRRPAGSRISGGGGGQSRCWRGSPRDSLARTPHKAANNNLGSVSAPEVSPAREYSPLEKFGRSLSFHNQLSSPKYENVCFAPRPRREERPSHRPAEDPVLSQADSANIAACSGRLHRRENSVFNILSDSTASQSGNCSPQGPGSSSVGEMNGGPMVGPSSSTTTTTTTSSAASQTTPLRHIGPVTQLLKAPPDNGSSTSCPMKGGANTDPCPLPVKSLRPKNTNPSQDPNTASEGEGGSEDSCPRVKKVMIWTELQASARQVTQIATSACGATAVINVLLAVDYGFSVEEVKSSIKTRLRAETAPLVDYLLSRSVAGTTHQDLIQGVTQLSQGAIKAKFFHMFPKRAVQLSRWLAQWISRGGVPVATLNLQVGVAPGQTIPDAWHHQMIFGVGPQGVYLTNPLECVSDCMLGDQLCTDSVLLVRRADVVNRWGNGDKLVRLTQQEDPRWRDMNVLGQVVGVLKEQAAPPVVQGRRHLTSHVAIPAAYKSGVTIFMRSDNPHLPTLMQAEDLPLLE